MPGRAEPSTSYGAAAFYERDYAAARELHEEGLVAVRQAGNSWDVAIALGDLGDVDHAVGDDAAAHRHYAESLALWQELRDERGIAQALEGFAMLDLAGSRTERAVRLLAAAQAIRERITEPSSPSRRASLDRLLDTARESIGESYEAIWAAGRVAPADQIIADALRRPAAETTPPLTQPSADWGLLTSVSATWWH